LLGAALIALSLLAGMAGYHTFEGLPWLDAFSNAAMILSGRDCTFDCVNAHS
jgi:hypothetical protein